MSILIGVAFTIITGCQKNESFVLPIVKSAPDEQLSQSNASPEAVTIVLARGKFTATGGIDASGIYSTSPVVQNGNTFHCTNTFVTEDGIITALSYCQMGSSKGAWRIVSGTGIYANISGTGTLVMVGPVEHGKEEFFEIRK